MRPFLSFAQKKPLLVISVTWLIMQSLIWIKYGIVTNLEATKYINAANYLIEYGTYPETKYLFYAITPLVIALNLKFGAGFVGAVITQLIFNYISTVLFYKLCYRLSNSVLPALASTLLLQLFVPYQLWNVYLYTESVFLSSIIIFLYFLHNIIIINYRHKLTFWPVFLFILSIVLVVTSRPFGMLFIPPLVIAFIFLLPKKYITLSIIICMAGIGFLYYALNRAFSGSADWNAMVSNINGHIICDIKDSRYASNDLKLLSGGNPVDQLLYYVFHNPVHYIQLSAERMYSFFNITRSYYSFGNNIYLFVYMLFIYGFFVAGLKSFYKSLFTYRIFLLMAIGFYTLATTLQCDDYHSRFIMALFPIFILIGTFGWKALFEKNGL